jgi:hypothetical protein
MNVLVEGKVVIHIHDHRQPAEKSQLTRCDWVMEPYRARLSMVACLRNGHFLSPVIILGGDGRGRCVYLRSPCRVPRMHPQPDSRSAGPPSAPGSCRSEELARFWHSTRPEIGESHVRKHSQVFLRATHGLRRSNPVLLLFLLILHAQ